MKASELFRVLNRKPLEYKQLRRTGSHILLRSENGYKDFIFAFHDSQTIPPRMVKKILTEDVGLSVKEAVELLNS